eukprot:7398005-Pyramimonas_sp.AAC.3
MKLYYSKQIGSQRVDDCCQVLAAVQGCLTDVRLAGVPRALEAVHGDDVGPEALRGERVLHRHALVHHHAPRALEHLDVLAGVATRRLHDAHALLKHHLAVRVVVCEANPGRTQRAERRKQSKRTQLVKSAALLESSRRCLDGHNALTRVCAQRLQERLAREGRRILDVARGLACIYYEIAARWL